MPTMMAAIVTNMAIWDQYYTSLMLLLKIMISAESLSKLILM